MGDVSGDLIQIVFEAGIKCIQNTSVLGKNTKSMKLMEVQEFILEGRNSNVYWIEKNGV